MNMKDSEDSKCLSEYLMSYNWQIDQSDTVPVLDIRKAERCDLYSGCHLMVHSCELHKNLSGEERSFPDLFEEIT